MRPDPMPEVPDSPEFDALQTLERAIAQQRELDPLIGPRLGSQVALDLLLEELGTDRGVHAETLLAVSGHLIGRSTHASLWVEAQRAGSHRIPGLHAVVGRDGSCLTIGDPLNRRLMEGLASPWGVLREAAMQEGCAEVPDGESLLLDGLRRLGTSAFGTPQVPLAHRPQVLPPSRQRELWGLMQALCDRCCTAPVQWPLLCSLLGARTLRLVKPLVNPTLAFRLVMDAAIDAAKLPLPDHATQGGTKPEKGSVP